MTAATFVVTAACVGCGACLATCPQRAFRVRRDAAFGGALRLVIGPACTACGECAEVCPAEACVEVPR